MRGFIVATAMAVCAIPVAAQEQEGPIASGTRCFYASNSFTEGSSIRIGDRILECNEVGGNPKWEPAKLPMTVNCLYKDNYYAAGSIESISSTKLAIICNADGTWSRVKD